MKLYSTRLSPECQRVRIALNLKQIDYELVSAEKEQSAAAPVLLTEGEQSIRQSLAIIEYLEEICPRPGLLPEDRELRARVRSFSHCIACDVQPMLSDPLGLESERFTEEELSQRVMRGLHALEYTLARQAITGTYCFGECLTMADVLLVPLVSMARRMKITMSTYPHIDRIYENCMHLTPFMDAAPELHP
ncbi:glutathione S-transferase N-terminal domain-containing protein [Spongorhabdus nitratireducens]